MPPPGANYRTIDGEDIKYRIGLLLMLNFMIKLFGNTSRSTATIVTLSPSLCP